MAVHTKPTNLQFLRSGQACEWLALCKGGRRTASWRAGKQTHGLMHAHSLDIGVGGRCSLHCYNVVGMNVVGCKFIIDE